MADNHRNHLAGTSGDLTRTIVDHQGRVWFVREMRTPPYDRRGSDSLVFLTDEVMRRVREYPPDWQSLSDEALYELSMHR
jgi:hypothetical protein